MNEKFMEIVHISNKFLVDLEKIFCTLLIFTLLFNQTARAMEDPHEGSSKTKVIRPLALSSPTALTSDDAGFTAESEASLMAFTAQGRNLETGFSLAMRDTLLVAQQSKGDDLSIQRIKGDSTLFSAPPSIDSHLYEGRAPHPDELSGDLALSLATRHSARIREMGEIKASSLVRRLAPGREVCAGADCASGRGLGGGSGASKLAALNVSQEKVPIVIAYRADKSGKGAFYDHYTMQRATEHPTRVSYADGQRRATLGEYIKTTVSGLSYGSATDGKIVPESIDISFDGGLLVIPGRLRENEHDELQNSHEQTLIRQAYNRGQPILSLCAGSWQLWRFFKGDLREVEDHCYRGGMVRESESSGDIVNNKQIHRIKVEQGSVLAVAMNHYSEEPLKVNSLHWKAADESKVPEILQITARAVADLDIAPGRCTGDKEKMHVEEHTVEAFENKSGAPMIGIQWHPEAYNHITNT